MTKVAIACQGGGSHTAFTAGVLSGLLRSRQCGTEFTIAALSGTSGGALCAGLVWSKLVRAEGQAQPDKDERADIATALKAFWRNIGADEELLFKPWWSWTFDYANAACNAWMVGLMRANPLAEQQCRHLTHITRLRMTKLLQKHIPLEKLKIPEKSTPLLRVGATDIQAGVSQPLAAEEHPAEELHKILMASASIPPLYDPTVLDHHYYWDGLYSHNPPVDCFTNMRPPPDEIWIIQINPECSTHPPRTPSELVDRRNELMGNLTLTAEMFHIGAINWLFRDPSVSPAVKDGLKRLGYKEIKLRLVSLQDDLDFASKYDRSWSQMKRLMDQGELAAHKFLEEKPEWSMPNKKHGLHEARLDFSAAHNGRESAAQPGFTFCRTMTCPAILTCNTSPLVDQATERAFEMGEKNLEFGL